MPAPWGRSRSARTSICTRCASRRYGAVPSGETQSDLPTTVVCTVSNADGSALRERLARGEQPKVTLHAEVDTGWRQTPILVAEIDGPTRMVRSSCTPAITTPGITA